jgi:hypothetical protein
MKYIEIYETSLRQYIDSKAVFDELARTRKDAMEIRGGMIWKDGYLVRTSATGGQKGLGARTSETEEIYRRFHARKALLENRVKDLETELLACVRRNFAEHVGRSPAMLVKVLNRLDVAGIAEHFLVVGTHALYAYEHAAGIRITEPGAMATKDIDLLWDTRKRIRLATQMNLQSTSLLGLLRDIDSTFRLSAQDRYKAINSKGFEVDVLRRESRHGDPHSLRITDHEDEFWAVQAREANKLLTAERLTAMIVSARGEMARMTTISPHIFIEFKRWMGQQSDREPEKRDRDILQADIVAKLVQDHRLAPNSRR